MKIVEGGAFILHYVSRSGECLLIDVYTIIEPKTFKALLIFTDMTAGIITAYKIL